jgi:hypothetical protein
MKLSDVAQEMRDIVLEKQNELGLQFFEEKHLYAMKDLSGNVRYDYPSVSKVLKKFYKAFPTDEAAYNKAGGDPVRQQQLIEEWAAAGTYSTNMGSRVHYLLEKKTLEKFEMNKELRKPEFNCDIEQMIKGDAMITAGTSFLKTMKKRGATLLDTEMVLGSNILGYTGQPDKVWVMENKQKTGFGIVITDWKTNKPKNFETNDFTEAMYQPFQKHPNNALGHYYLQLPFYGKLLLEMLKGSKYEDTKLLGCVVVLLKETGDYVEYKVPQDVVNIIMEMNMQDYLKK